MFKVLFVCTGNICRSPTAEGVFRHIVREAGLDERIMTDSAGTDAYHVGEHPDPRSVQAARARKIEIGYLLSRQVRPADFEEFDLILAMDAGHLHHLTCMAPPGIGNRIRLFLDFAPGAAKREVPDPYYGEGFHFDEVLDLIEAGAEGLLADIRLNHLKAPLVPAH